MPRSTRRPGAKLLLCLALATTALAIPAAAQPLDHFDSGLFLFSDVDGSGSPSCGDHVHSRVIVSSGIGSFDLTNLTVHWDVPSNTRIVPGNTTLAFGPESDCTLLSGTLASDREVVAHCSFLCRTGGDGTDGTCIQVGLDLQARLEILDPNLADQVVVTATADADQVDLSTSEAALAYEPCPPANPPVLAATLIDTLGDDRDGDGQASAGDQLHYLVHIANTGGSTAFETRFRIPPPEHTELVVGSVFAPPGATITSGNAPGDVTVDVTIGDLAPGAEVGLLFDVLIASPLPPEVDHLSAQGAVDAVGVATVTDDPATPSALDPTITPIDQAPDLAVDKIADPPSAEAGGVGRFTIGFANLGRTTALGVFLREIVPAHTRFAAADSSPGWSCPDGAGPGTVCDLVVGSVVPGTPGLRTFAVRVDERLPFDVTATTNTVSIADDGSGGPDPDPSSNVSTADLALVASPELALSKSGPASARAGDVIAYTLTATNRGGRDAAGAELLDAVPPHSRFDAGRSTGGWSCPEGAAPGTTCTLDLGNLPAGSSLDATFAVRVDAALPHGAESLANTALLRDGAGSPQAEATATTALDAAPTLTLAKTGPAAAAPGDLLHFDLAYANTGDQDAAGITLTETVPAPAQFAAAASSPGWSCPDASPAGTTCTLSLGALAAGEAGAAAFAVRLPPSLAAGVETLTNTATLRDADGTPPATDDATVALDAAPRLVLDKTGPAAAQPGQTIAFTLTATNAGDQDAASAALHDTVPAHTTFDAGASTSGWSCTDGASPGTACTLDVGPLSSGDSAGATFAVRLAATVPADLTAVRNTALLTGGPSDPPGEDDVEIPVDAAPDLVLDKTGPSTARPGNLVPFTLAYRNAGDRDSTPAELVETIPDHTTFSAADSTAGWSCPDGAPTGTACTLALGPLAAGASGTATFAVRLAATVPPDLTAVRNTAVLTGGPSDPPGDDDVDIPVDASTDLVLDKTGPSTARPGDLIPFTLAYRNAGDRDTAATVLGDSVPDHTTFSAADSTPGWSCPEGAPAGTTCTLALGPLVAGASGTATFAVRLAANVPPDLTAVRNTALLTGGPSDPPGEDDVDVPVDAAADLVLDKRGPATATPGDTLVYTLDHANRGDTTAAGALLTETVPAHTTFAAAAASPGWSCAPGAAAGSTCALPLGDLAPGAAGSATFAVRVAANAPTPGEIVNTATLTDAAGHPPATDRVTTTLTAPPPEPPTGEPHLSAILIDTFLEDTDADGRLGPGDVVGYTAVVSNPSATPAHGVRFTLTPDPHTELIPATVTTNGGTIESGAGPADAQVAVALGDLPAAGESTVTFEVRLLDPLPADVAEIAAQGDVTAADAAATVTDDPDTAEPLDPTRTPLGDDAGPPEIVEIPTLQGLGLAALALLLAAVAYRRLTPARRTAR